MKEIVVNNFKELQDVIFKDCFDPKTMRYRDNCIYRGIEDISFSLNPKLNRICAHNLNLEEAVIRSFRKYGYADIKDTGSFWQVLAMGQHYGLPTRLLDWTYSPFVAAHFATENINAYNQDGAIYTLDLGEAQKQLPEVLKKELAVHDTQIFTISLLDKHAENLKEFEALSEEPFFIFYEPASGSDRMANQYALFSMCSKTDVSFEELLEKNCEESLKKIILPKEAKLEIRDKLDYINISERLIYPGLDGICRWITRRYADLGPIYNQNHQANKQKVCYNTDV